MKDMDAALWGGLPSEIAERVLSYLSAPILCKFRTVCKRWNSLICNPDYFGALCIQNATTQDAVASFVALSYIKTEEINKSGPVGNDSVFCRKSRAWAFLDVMAKRWYTIETKLTNDELKAMTNSFNGCGRCLAMDGGLVCQLLPSHKNTSVFICNPIAQTESRILLPTPKHYLTLAHSMVDMVVDVSTSCYTIFVLPNERRKPWSEENPFMVIYESRTHAWRSSSLPMLAGWERIIGVEGIVWFNGLLYVLAWAHRFQANRWSRLGLSPLWSYNHVEDQWKDSGVVIDVCGLHSMGFVMSDNRLFLASWVDEEKDWTYQVSEINLQDRSLRTVLRVTAAAMMELFELFRVVHHPPSDMHLQAIGLGKVIVFLSRKSGITRVYDLRTCTWDALQEILPPLPMMPNFNYHIYSWKAMSLVMPSASELWRKNVTKGKSLANV